MTDTPHHNLTMSEWYSIFDGCNLRCQYCGRFRKLDDFRPGRPIISGPGIHVGFALPCNACRAKFGEPQP